MPRGYLSSQTVADMIEAGDIPRLRYRRRVFKDHEPVMLVVEGQKARKGSVLMLNLCAETPSRSGKNN